MPGDRPIPGSATGFRLEDSAEQNGYDVFTRRRYVSTRRKFSQIVSYLLMKQLRTIQGSYRTLKSAFQQVLPQEHESVPPVHGTTHLPA
ncbi:MAG: hypothetical protein NTV54_06585 [Ignavibacteriales bacterium]|nr:hypothetical protein [Ignavibacteriales bacterium]